MPIYPTNISDIQFDERDLFLGVSLTTITIEPDITRDPDTGFLSGESYKDFTGRPTFKTGFFRDGVGFGITNIKISTNASLQPTVDIEFKDLYGKTVFGELNGAETDGISYAALFQWPPPKFEFTFKGYLGCPVTWILNMKTTSTQYNSDDGSYTIKATFVPNQWGMFADLPFLYLYAVKKLKQDSLGPKIKPGTPAYDEATASVIDLMYTGKKFKKKTEKVAKDYDKLSAKLELLKRDAITGIISGTLSFDDPDNKIDSSTPNRPEIAGFKTITLSRPPDKFYESENKDDIITGLKALTANQRVAENLRIKIAALNPKSQVLKTYKFGKSGDNVVDLKKEADKLSSIIDANIALIDSAVKAALYREDKESLQKLTISQVFSRIAKDAAYIMGYILDAGEQGFINAIESRLEGETQGDIIGLYYPMKFEPPKEDKGGTKDLGRQVPAKDDKYKTKEYELLFVNNFITAVSYGIAQNKVLQEDANNGVGGEDKIIHRINNLELISKNPFLEISDWKEFASIIMKRAAVISHFTKSWDPNYPGGLEEDADMDDSGGWAGNSEKILPEDIRKAADADIKNVTDGILASLEEPELQGLKEFATFWTTLFNDPDGNYIENEDGAEEYITNVAGGWFGFDQSAGAGWFGGNANKSVADFNRRIVFLYSGIEGFSEDARVNKIVDAYSKLLSDKYGTKNGVLSYSANKVALANLEAIGVYDRKRNIINYNTALGGKLKEAGFLAYTVEQFLEQFIGKNYMFYGTSTNKSLNGEYQVPTLKASFSFANTVAYYVNFNNLTFIHPHFNLNNLDYQLTEYVLFTESEDIAALEAFEPSENESDDKAVKDDEENKNAGGEDAEESAKLTGINILSGRKIITEEEGKRSYVIDERLSTFNTIVQGGSDSPNYNDDYATYPVLDYSWSKSRLKYSEISKGAKYYTSGTLRDAAGKKIFYVEPANFASYRSNATTINSRWRWNAASRVAYNFSGQFLKQEDDDNTFYIDVNSSPIAYAPMAECPPEGESFAEFYARHNQLYASAGSIFMNFYDDSTGYSGLAGQSIDIRESENIYGAACRTFLRQFCKNLLGKIQKIEDEKSKVFGQILGRAGEHEDLLYQQMHTLFHQWQILASPEGERLNNQSKGKGLQPVLANKLESIFGETVNNTSSGGGCEREVGEAAASGFRYDYPLQSYETKEDVRAIKVEDSLINLDPLYEAKGNTTVLNVFQQLCSKNNFMFFPIAGNARYQNISEIFNPSLFFGPKIGNFFQVMFQPTPENRTLGAAKPNEPQSLSRDLEDFAVQAFPVSFGDPSNKLIKNVTVGTDENKVTAESIVNLQRIVDNENNNKTVTTDCSLLKVVEGRSYKAKLETLGNAQISPMQFFYLKNHTIFTGLYQIIKVDHNITPNNMTTDFEGIKMRYGGAEYGGIHPITIADYEEAAGFVKEATNEVGDASQINAEKEAASAARSSSSSSGGGGGASGGSGDLANVDYKKGAGEANTMLKSYKTAVDNLVKELIKQGVTQDKAIAGIMGIVSKESGFKLQFESGYGGTDASRINEIFGKRRKYYAMAMRNGAKNLLPVPLDIKREFPTNAEVDKIKSKNEWFFSWLYGYQYGNDNYTATPPDSGWKKSTEWLNDLSGKALPVDGKDGYRYRGGGYNQITFKANYAKFARETGIDFLRYPERIIQSPYAEQGTTKFFLAQFVTMSSSKKAAYNTKNSNDFVKVSDAVSYMYHCNAGPGKEVSSILSNLNDSESGLSRAQRRAPTFLNYLREQKFAGLVITQDLVENDNTANNGGGGTTGGGTGGAGGGTGDNVMNKIESDINVNKA